MANEKNLAPKIKSGRKAREMGRKGGIKSGEAKREKKLMREALEKKIGKSLDEITEALLAKAATGDVRAYEVIRDTLGEKPTDKVEVTGAIDTAEAASLENEIMFPSDKKKGGD